MDASLKELTSLIRDVNPDTRRKGTYFDFALVYPDSRPGTYRMREIGVTCSGQRGADDSKTLGLVKFQIGDYLDINITPANRKPEPRMDRRDRRPY
jgi:histone deacetylase complex subunit SAP18